MPEIRAISHVRLLPLSAARPRLLGIDQLRALHGKNHPTEPNLALTWRQFDRGLIQKGTYFFDQWVGFSRPRPVPSDVDLVRLGTVDYKPLAAVAAQHLENTFGRIEEVFVTDWAPLAPAIAQKDGYAHFIAYDPETDCVIAKTTTGLTLSLQGSNLIEAAIWLPRIENQVRQNLPWIAAGVQSVSVGIGQGGEWSREASPLKMSVQVDDFRQHNPLQSAEFDRIAAETFQRALFNRVA